MTPYGNAVLIGILVLSVIGLIAGALRGERTGDKPLSHGAGRRASSPRGGAKEGTRDMGPTEPVRFRTTDAVFVDCRAEMPSAQERDIREMGFSMGLEGSAAVRRYQRKELAYVLADQLLAAGGIAFSTENGMLRAQLRAVVPGPSQALRASSPRGGAKEGAAG